MTRYIPRTEGLIWAKAEGNTIIINHEDFDELIKQEYEDGYDVFNELEAIVGGTYEGNKFFLT